MYLVAFEQLSFTLSFFFCFSDICNVSVLCAKLRKRNKMTSEGEIFHTVLHELTGEQFLDFVERFLNTRVLLPGMDVQEGGAGSPSSIVGRLDWINLPGADVGNPEYSHAHLDCFQQYKALYESRLKATLRKFNLTEEEFISRCAIHVNALDEADAADVTSPKTSVSHVA